MGNVRPISDEVGPEDRKPRRPFVLAAITACVGLVAWISVFGFAATESPEVVSGLSTQEAREALAIVEDFRRAIDEVQVGDAVAMLAPGTRVDLPGLPIGYVNPYAPSARMEQALAFYGRVVDLELGPCRVEGPQSLYPHTRVICNEAMVGGKYAEAMRSAGVATTMIFGVDDQRITSVLRAPVGAPHTIHYCAWAEENRPSAAAGLFDNQCWPVAETESDAAAHAELAAEYVADGLPEADEEYLAMRWSAGMVVDRFFTLHNDGVGPPHFFAPGEVAALPGMVGDVNVLTIDQADMLAWSATMYRVDLGDCSVRSGEKRNTVRVACPGAQWGGPLVDALALSPIEQPVAFEVVFGSITEVEGATAPSLSAAFDAFCRWVYETQPAGAVSDVFTEGCTPVYERNAAREMLRFAVTYGAKLGF